MSEPIQPALTAEEWEEALDDWDGERVPLPYPPDERDEFYSSPRRLAALCLYRQPFGFTRQDVSVLRFTAKALNGERGAGTITDDFNDLADRIEALLPPEKPS